MPTHAPSPNAIGTETGAAVAAAAGEVLTEWLTLCADTPEFVANYNRLTGHSVTFAAPERAPIERMVDAACGHLPEPKNDPAELQHFMEFCAWSLAPIGPAPALPAPALRRNQT